MNCPEGHPVEDGQTFCPRCGQKIVRFDNPEVPAGWYAVSGGSGEMRYWNGSQWAPGQAQPRPLQSGPPPGQEPTGPVRGRVERILGVNWSIWVPLALALLFTAGNYWKGMYGGEGGDVVDYATPYDSRIPHHGLIVIGAIIMTSSILYLALRDPRVGLPSIGNLGDAWVGLVGALAAVPFFLQAISGPMTDGDGTTYTAGGTVELIGLFVIVASVVAVARIRKFHHSGTWLERGTWTRRS